jgi:thioredoxin reductase (NADPH)
MLSTQEAEAQPVTDAPYSSLSTRRHQMFPDLTPEEIARIRRFGEERHWEANQMLFETGRPGPGMFVMLRGSVKVIRRC